MRAPKEESNPVIFPAVGIVLGASIGILLFIFTAQAGYIVFVAGIGLVFGSVLCAVNTRNKKFKSES